MGAGQDWAPGHVGHLAFVKSKGQKGVMLIQVLHPNEIEQEIPDVDIVVQEPAGSGKLLVKIAAVVEEYRQRDVLQEV